MYDRQPQRHPEWRMLAIFLAALDLVAIFGAFATAYYVRFFIGDWPGGESFPDVLAYRVAAAVLVVVWIIFFAIAGLYRRENLGEGPREYALVVQASTSGLVVASLGAFFLTRDPWLSRGWLLLGWAIGISYVGFARFSARRIIFFLRHRGQFLSRVLIVGANEQGKAIARQLSPADASGVEVVGFVDDYLPPGAEVLPGLRVEAEPLSAVEAARALRVDELLVVPSAVSWEGLHHLVQVAQMEDSAPTIRLSAGLWDVLGTGFRVSRKGYIPLLTIDRTRVTGFDAVLKRALDWTAAGLAIVLLSPIVAIVWAIVTVGAGRLRFVRRDRVGRLGRSYGQWILSVEGSGWGTRFGHYVLGAGLGAYPRLFNVVRREESLVGPRPMTGQELALAGPWRANLLSLRPGMTGPWWLQSSASGPARVERDLWYLRNYTIWLDLQVLFQTGRVLLSRLFNPHQGDRQGGTRRQAIDRTVRPAADPVPRTVEATQ